jgi:predicted TIM-barrel fold metal-dependent hydrolase
MILDAHVHIGKWDDPLFAHTWTTVEQLNETLIEAGIDGAVVTSSDRRQNQQLLDHIEKYGTLKYWVFPWVDPAEEGDVAFLRDNSARISGLKLHPTYTRLPLTDPAYDPYLDLARSQDWPLLVHCGQWQEMASYKFVLERAVENPEIDFILAHGGGNNAKLRLEVPGEIERRGSPPNVYIGLSGLGLWWAVEIAINELGCNRFLYGSDYPLGHPKVLLGLIAALRISDSNKEQILGRNLLKLLTR